MKGASLSAAEARRIALAAQGFARARPRGAADARHMRRVISELGLLQLDFVNVLVPAHYLVVWSRLGPYERQRFDRLVHAGGEFTEHWAHEASIVPTASWPLLAYRRHEYRPWPQSAIMQLCGRKEYLRTALEIVRERGPVVAGDLPPMPGPARRAGDWYRSVARSALEYHFGHGNIAVAGRLPNFQRQYDLPERVIAEEVRQRTHAREDAFRALLRQAARACGIATARDLADYWRMSPKEARPRIAELMEEGTLAGVSVEGWHDTAYLHAEARLPRTVGARALLSPFDPLVWFRPRAERLFDFHYRLEIYVPAAQRKWGYYVLPFLLDDRIVARVDLKAERNAGQLQVLAAYPEEGIDEKRSVMELATELRALAEWLDLGKVRVGGRGRFSGMLARAARALGGR